MVNHDDYTERFEKLREKASDLLLHRPGFVLDPSDDILDLIHELRIHQAELVLQNEELQRSQQELSALYQEFEDLYEFAPCGYVTIDRKGIISRANLTAVNLFSADRQHLYHSTISQFIVPEHEGFYLAARQQAVKTGKQISVEFPLARKTQPPVWVMAQIEAVCDEHDEVEQWRVTLVDITAQKTAEAAKDEFEKRLKHAQKMEAIGTLAGGIAHDFNNILGIIIGYTELVRDDSPKGSRTVKDLDQVILAALRARDIVKQILAFSHQTETIRVPLQPIVLVGDAARLLRSSLPTTIDIKLNLQNPCDLVLADPAQFHQIIMNLCTNAFHAMEEKGGILSIGLKNRALSKEDLVNEPDVPPGNFVELSVSDSGTGILPEIRGRIFDPYFTTKETGKGTGMGLAIVHGIVRRYGGFVTCESQVGRGTTFSVNLPSQGEDTLSQSPEEAPVPTGNERILFVDDEQMLAEMSKTMLERLGYSVTIRTSSLEALSTFEKEPDGFDLVMTDQTMPFMTGFDLAKRMQRIRPDLPIILCSGYSSVVSEEQAISAGIRGFVLKPLIKKEIAVVIRNVLDQD